MGTVPEQEANTTAWWVYVLIVVGALIVVGLVAWWIYTMCQPEPETTTTVFEDTAISEDDTTVAELNKMLKVLIAARKTSNESTATLVQKFVTNKVY